MTVSGSSRSFFHLLFLFFLLYLNVSHLLLHFYWFISTFHHITGNIDPFCQANPTSIVPHPDTCGQYYNCSAMSKYGHHLQECHYPDLFDEVSLTCKNFEQVKCNKSKHEPEAPCKFEFIKKLFVDVSIWMILLWGKYPYHYW